jgi:hypothetical protein
VGVCSKYQQRVDQREGSNQVLFSTKHKTQVTIFSIKDLLKRNELPTRKPGIAPLFASL